MADVVRRRERLRRRLGDRGLPLPARDPGHARSTSVASGGRSDGDRGRLPSRRRRVDRGEPSAPKHRCASSARRRSTSSSSASALLWLVPTLGLFVTSLLRADGLQRAGLVEDLHRAEQAHLRELRRASSTTRRSRDSLWTTVLDHGRRRRSCRRRRRAGRLRVRLARVPRPRLAVHRRHRAAGRAAPDGADPDLLALQHVGIFDTVLGLVLFHTAFGLPFAIFLLRNFFIGIPKDLLEAARIDGASEIRIFVAADPAARPAGDRVARDLPVPVDVERPARRADLRPRRRSRSRSRSSRQLRQFGSNIELIAPASFVSLVDPAGGLLRLPALLRPGPAGRLGQVDLLTRVSRSSARGLGGFVAYATLRHGGLRAGARSRSSARTPTRPARGGRERESIRQRAMRSESDGHCCPASFPGLAAREAARRRARRRSLLRRVRTATARASTEFLRHVERAARAVLGRELRGARGWSGSAPSTAASSSTARPLPARAARARPSRASRVPAELAGRPACRARLRAARVRRPRRRRRRRHGGGDRVAERARRGRRGRRRSAGASPRAGR